MSLKELGEFALIDKIKNLVEMPSKNVVIGIDDDAAAVNLSNDKTTLLTTDALIEGVHFNLKYFSYYQLGWRALAANLSDIAAMAGWPKYAIVTLGLPETLCEESVLEIYHGMKDLADKFQVMIVGGDTIKSPDRIYISITVVGEVDENKMTRRSGAQVGDGIFVTGHLGGSKAGLKVLNSPDKSLKMQVEVVTKKHLNPVPRVEEASFLVDSFPIHSMIDISDGLASEINHICRLSAVGAILIESHIPIAGETNMTADFFKETSLDYALYGGEDFELLFTAPLKSASEIQQSFEKKFGIVCSNIGQIVNKSDGIVLESADNKKRALAGCGFDHFARNE